MVFTRRSSVLKPLAHELRHAVLAGLASVPRVPGPKNSTKQKPGRELLEFCNGRRDDVLRFTTDTAIWPTNNISERGVRPLKTQQKISGRLASDDVTQARLDIRELHRHRPQARQERHGGPATSCSARPGDLRHRNSPRNLSQKIRACITMREWVSLVALAGTRKLLRPALLVSPDQACWHQRIAPLQPGGEPSGVPLPILVSSARSESCAIPVTRETARRRRR